MSDLPGWTLGLPTLRTVRLKVRSPILGAPEDRVWAVLGELGRTRRYLLMDVDYGSTELVDDPDAYEPYP